MCIPLSNVLFLLFFNSILKVMAVARVASYHSLPLVYWLIYACLWTRVFCNCRSAKVCSDKLPDGPGILIDYMVLSELKFHKLGNHQYILLVICYLLVLCTFDVFACIYWSACIFTLVFWTVWETCPKMSPTMTM